MGPEIKNTVYIGISCSLLAFVLGFVMIMGSIRDSIGNTRMNEISGQNQIERYNEFYMYNEKWLTGMELIKLITDTSSTELTVYVSNIDADSSVNGTFNKQLYISNPEVYDVKDKDGDKTLNECTLVKWYAHTSELASKPHYKTYIMTNNPDPSKLKEVDLISEGIKSTAEVTGIYVVYYDVIPT